VGIGIVGSMRESRKTGLAAELMTGRWGLERAREFGRRIVRQPKEIKRLMEAIFSEDEELRKRASDVAHRVSDAHADLLESYADELAGVLAELLPGESRMRWHMGLVVARSAHTREQRLRAAWLVQLLLVDESNVARCSGVEGMGLLAIHEPSLVGEVEEMIGRALWNGTPAMKARARHAKLRLEKATKLRL